MRKITEHEIAEIKNKATKPTIYNGNFPLNDISDREFETLCYLIFKERLKYDDKDLSGSFDNIDLMSGVGEKGFDSTLYSKGKIAGLIQCKKYKTRLTKPQTLHEILKFALNALLKKELIPDKKKFTYYLIASSGFANTAIDYLSSFNEEIVKEDLAKLCQPILKKYESLKNIDIDKNIDELKEILRYINIKKVIPEDLNIFLAEYSNITKTFFKIYTATDNTLIEKVIKTYLVPILNKVSIGTTNKISTNDFQFRFKTYLAQVLNKYSSAQTLVFGNQQKKIEDYYYPLTLTCKNGAENPLKINTHKYTDDFIPKFQKVLICDHGGMGKSTILKWLFRSATIQNKGIPIFIELRGLSKKNTIVDEITKQLEPLDYELEKSVTKNLISKGGFIFFLDGYDEISKKNKKDVTKDLSNFITKACENLFVISSRPEEALKTFGDFQEFSIDRLTALEAYELIKKIGNNNDKSLQLIEQLKNDKRKELTEFLESPLLISLLYKKFEHRETIPIQKQEFYWEVFEALFQAHDIIKGDRFEREKETGLSLHEFHKILRGLAYFTGLINQVEYNQVELERFIKKSNDFFPGIKFDKNKFITDIITNVPIFQKEGLKYKWSHKTLQEYFAAEFICRDTKAIQGEILQRLCNEENSKSYFGIVDMCYDIDYKSFRKYLLYPKCKEYVSFYNENVLPHLTNDNFEMIERIANQLFEGRIAFFKPDTDSFKRIIENIEKLNLEIRKYCNHPVQGLEIILGIEKLEIEELKTAVLKIRKSFPLKRLLENKKSNLIKKCKTENSKNKSIIVNYDITLEGVDFYFLPNNTNEILNKYLGDLEAFTDILDTYIYNIKTCNKLIESVDEENKKEEDRNFFFEGLN